MRGLFDPADAAQLMLIVAVLAFWWIGTPS